MKNHSTNLTSMTTGSNLHDRLQIYGRECHPERLVFPSHMHVHSYHNDLLQHIIISQQL